MAQMEEVMGILMLLSLHDVDGMGDCDDMHVVVVNAGDEALLLADVVL